MFSSLVRVLHIIAVTVAALCFATTGTAQALADLDASPIAVGAARGLLGGALLAAAAWLVQRRTPGSLPWLPAMRSSRTAVALGVLGVLAYNALFFVGTALNGVAVGTVVAIGSAPVAAGALEAIVLRKPPQPRWMVATAVAIIGVTLVAGLVNGQAAASGITITGLLASIGAGSSYALYTFASKSLFERGWSTATTMGTLFGLSGLLGAPILLVMDTAWLWTSRGIALTLWLSVVTVALAYSLWAWGLTGLRTSTVATLTLAEPMGATLLGLFVLSESLTGPAAIGVGFIALGLVIVALPSRRRHAISTLTPPTSP